MMQEQDNYQRGYTLGSDPNYGAYYANDEGDFFAAGFVDGRISLYERVENEGGTLADTDKRDALLQALWSGGVRGALRQIEHQEEE